MRPKFNFRLSQGFYSKFQDCGYCKISLKKSKTSHLDRSSYIEGDIIQNHEAKKNKRSEK